MARNEKLFHGTTVARASAILIVELEQEDLAALRRSGDMVMKGFDAADAPDLRHEPQWLLRANGVRLLNRLAAEFSWVQV